MLIVSGELYVDEEARNALVDAHSEMMARASSRVVYLVIAADLLEADRINLEEVRHRRTESGVPRLDVLKELIASRELKGTHNEPAQTR